MYWDRTDDEIGAGRTIVLSPEVSCQRSEAREDPTSAEKLLNAGQCNTIQSCFLDLKVDFPLHLLDVSLPFRKWLVVMCPSSIFGFHPCTNDPLVVVSVCVRGHVRTPSACSTLLREMAFKDILVDPLWYYVVIRTVLFCKLLSS